MADRIVIPFELDKVIVERVDTMAEHFGLVRDEALRLMIAIGLDEWETQHPGASITRMFPGSLFGGQLTGVRSLGSAQSPPGSNPGGSLAQAANDQAFTMAKIMASQGGLKCPEYTQGLKAKDIISGQCPNCHTEL